MLHKNGGLLLFLTGLCWLPQSQAGEAGGRVTDPAMASALADRHVSAVYDEETARRQRPWQIKDNGDAWILIGRPPEALGGNITIEIAKRDGAVIQLSHSK
ncbi:NTF2 fold immunity protein [Intestinirhabdus alba]|jgi:hypothetical protein|uniref:NTF2 fold domain-containing protein n=1 Tax=Intestinirhabdus alba TaxID=2899544 RepID=A0A6L6IH93_9ENTR|nr:NTF2 fold immunity protein [Intestinirhabdus alba]MTH46191.1 hypothetical protein [Intestinirhabdus alba]